ncbi:MAG: hypothetical protein M0T74_00385 [Desulfitobacterium hafniense]|nr:hypothetical protein [Desulfitobacterium hafniense]
MRGSEGFFEDLILTIAGGYLNLCELAKLLNFLNKSLMMFPQHSSLFVFRGLAHYHSTQYVQAARDLLEALKLSKHDLLSGLETYYPLSDSEPNCPIRISQPSNLNFNAFTSEYLAIAAREIQTYLFSLEQGLDNEHFPATLELKNLLKEVFAFTAYGYLC